MKREVVRILTDGTIYEEELIDDTTQNISGLLTLMEDWHGVKLQLANFMLIRLHLIEKNSLVKILRYNSCKFNIVEILFNEDINKTNLFEEFGYKKI